MRDHGVVVAARVPRDLARQLGLGPAARRGDASALLRRLLAEEAARRGIVVAQVEAQQPQRPAA